jgi:hypothetical protein
MVRLMAVIANRLLGSGSANTWARDIIKQVGKHSGLELDRGPNALWRKGGLMYPIPFR